ncbi:hypothetical protein PRIPAC_93477 [Pristionchus pacificus]|uniref:Uncharacterized protein n=1 Tax=Pristionchus pacificus TaxID=54126 RepID=A0A2A6BBG9_PRIPA|nr:hypothetical protein PRIPAC_93477 [Pristionchus pacificus]|eukprot:PDM63223.1 hypothetical protein PRIPAC_50438 [Pristionchus pacificus]
MREAEAPYALLGDTEAPQSNFSRRILQLIILCGVLLLGAVVLYGVDAWSSSLGGETWTRNGCGYLNNDLVHGLSDGNCDEIPKIRTKKDGQLLSNKDAEIAFAPSDFDFSAEDFDYSHCEPFSTFKVFVPRVDHPLAKALAQHPAATSSQHGACVEIEFADAQKPLYSLPRANSNLLVVNLDPSSTVAATGSVLIAQSRYGPGTFRSSLDFALHPSVPAFDVNEWKQKPSILPAKRPILSAYISDSSDPTKLVNSSSDIESISCTHTQCAVDLSLVSFCMLSPSPLFQALLLLSLHSACIPVVMSLTQPLPFQDHLDWKHASLRFPHSAIGQARQVLETLAKEDILEMRRQGTVFSRRLDNAEALARSLLAAVAEKMQLQLPTVSTSSTKPVFATYETNNSYQMELKDKKYRRITSPFDHHRYSAHRLYSPSRWNSGRDLTFTPRTLHDVHGLPAEAEYYDDSEIIRTAGSQNYGAFARGLGINREPEQFTVLLMTYHRDEGVKEIIKRLNNCPHLNKVLVVWNNVGRDPSGAWPNIHVPVEFVRSARNSLNNRFMPYDRIETEVGAKIERSTTREDQRSKINKLKDQTNLQAVFSIDDDMDVAHDELVYAFKVWRQNRDRIVGFVDRFHSWWEDTSRYGNVGSCEYSLLLDSYFVAHKEFFYEYTNNMHPAIRQHVDDTVNCGDIAFNYLVSHLTRKPPLKVKKIVGLWNSKSHPGLSGQGDHYRERDGCVQKFNAIYGYNPLLFSQYQAMPVMDQCVRGM